MYSPLASLTAMLLPFGKPTLALFSMSLMCGKRARIIAQLSSEEWLSTTIISASKF